MSEMIDEAAALEYHNWVIKEFGCLPDAHTEVSAALSALRWKARAEAAEAALCRAEAEINRMSAREVGR